VIQEGPNHEKVKQVAETETPAESLERDLMIWIENMADTSG
jgi:hypothetical protein